MVFRNPQLPPLVIIIFIVPNKVTFSSPLKLNKMKKAPFHNATPYYFSKYKNIQFWYKDHKFKGVVETWTPVFDTKKVIHYIVSLYF